MITAVWAIVWLIQGTPALTTTNAQAVLVLGGAPITAWALAGMVCAAVDILARK